MRDFPKNMHSIAFALLLTTIVAILVACSSSDPTPTRRSGTEEQPVKQTVEALSINIAALETEVAALGEEAKSLQETEQLEQGLLAPEPKTARTETTETQAYAPQPTAAAEPTPDRPADRPAPGPGICGRSPAVQDAIVHTLRTPLCRLVTTEDLYRITKFWDLMRNQIHGFHTVSPGDLTGLVNLETLSIPGNEPLQRGALKGAGVGTLDLRAEQIGPGTFDGLVRIGTLTISEAGEFPNLTAPELKELTELRIDFDGPFPDLKGSELEKLTNLKTLVLTGGLYEGLGWDALPEGSEPGRQYHMPHDLFSNNQGLERLELSIEGHHTQDGQRHGFTLPRNILAKLGHLRALVLGMAEIEPRGENEPPLTLAPESPLRTYLERPEVLPEGWGGSLRQQAIDRWDRWETNAPLEFSMSQ